MIEYSDISRLDRQRMSELMKDQSKEIDPSLFKNAKKSAYVMNLNIAGFVQYFGIDKCGFLTLTFPDDVTCTREASKRFNSMRTNFLKKYTRAYIGVYERTKRGVIHFHFIVALKDDIRTGFDFEAVKRGIYTTKTCNPAIRTLWKLLREKLQMYGFGRHELVPIKSQDGIARYLAKYIIKGLDGRTPADKGFRFVRQSQDKAQQWRRATHQFAWHSPNAQKWREALCHWVESQKRQIEAAFFNRTGFEIYVDEENYSQIYKILFGAKWCYHSKESIILHYQRHNPERLLT